MPAFGTSAEEVEMEAGAAAQSPHGDLASYVWLQSGPLDYFPAKGSLHLSGGRLIFVIDESPPEKHAVWLEEVSGQPGLAKRLQDGERATIFDVPVSEAEVKFPGSAMGSLVLITVGGTRYRLNFYDPTRGGPGTKLGGVFKGGSEGRQWKRALKGD
jgi:hypothetical protein